LLLRRDLELRLEGVVGGGSVAGVVVTLVGDLVEDAGKVPMESCVCSSKTGTLETGEAASTHKVTTEVDSITGCKGRKQKLQNPESYDLQIDLGGPCLAKRSRPVDQNQDGKLIDKRLVDKVTRHQTTRNNRKAKTVKTTDCSEFCSEKTVETTANQRQQRGR
jgi:hypothetical protein